MSDADLIHRLASKLATAECLLEGVRQHLRRWQDTPLCIDAARLVLLERVSQSLAAAFTCLEIEGEEDEFGPIEQLPVSATARPFDPISRSLAPNSSRGAQSA